MDKTNSEIKKASELDPEAALRTTVWDGLNTVMRAGMSTFWPLLPVVGAVPGAGSVAAEAFGSLTGPVLSRRHDEFLTNLWRCVVVLEEKFEGFSVSELVQDEQFVTVLLQATRSATATHLQGKHLRLRNAILNVALEQFAQQDGRDDQRLLFLHLIDRMGDLEAQLLGFMVSAEAPMLDLDAIKWFRGAVACDAEGKLIVADTNLAFATIMDHVCEHFGYEGCPYWWYLGDLYNMGLVRIGGPNDDRAKAEFVQMVFDKHHGATSGPCGVTDTALALLQFVKSPLPDDSPTTEPLPAP